MRFSRHRNEENGQGRHEYGRRFARGPNPQEREERRFGRGGRLARLLEHGDLRMLILYLINEKPCHGYEIIKAIEDLTGGAYAPSPGVVYPTLTMLEELGHVTAEAEGSRKSFAITADGAAVLAESQTAVAAMLARLAQAKPREDAFPVRRAMENLSNVLRHKLHTKATSPEVTRKIVDTLDAIARKIEEF
jgi:DNA-binding PadR family transcriptional regulator